MPTVLETTDLGLAHHVLSAAYGTFALTDVRGPCRVRFSRDTLGPAEIHHNSFTMGFHVSGPPFGQITVGRLASGVIVSRVGREERRHATPGELFVCDEPHREHDASFGRADVEFAVLQRDLLAQVAAAAPGRAARPLRFTGFQPVSPAAAAVWSSTYDFVRDNLTTIAVADGTLLSGNAARLLAATALSTFPNNSVHEPTAGDRHDAHPATLRRAIAFIDDNAHRDLSAADIAAAVHVTIRTLQLTFRRHLDTTPMAYLRRVRLEHAHCDLVRGDPATVTVGAVAARWGIMGHSRFTALYRAAYGVTPSSTLHGRSG